MRVRKAKKAIMADETLPAWLLKKGLIDVHGYPMTKSDIREMIKFNRKKGRDAKFWKDLLDWPFDYFEARDVAKAFKRIQKKQADIQNSLLKLKQPLPKWYVKKVKEDRENMIAHWAGVVIKKDSAKAFRRVKK